ncbi:hypothetical protein GCWU000341_02819 [Oribacterium sp. oral taxon 078 str. F0262]|uniref:hypothetical protein n=1 Tax=Oribacterium sp. oral taxon 078 TaxID=652706 RepID=UPI0001BCC45A|nr:hypothetical protein [Oribacterium sp. oral taxon 078]EFE90553.1 hypothetical protein GCWU000341_02819 [Oribacterium sp. oral taxon 078 str. F0262]
MGFLRSRVRNTDTMTSMAIMNMEESIDTKENAKLMVMGNDSRTEIMGNSDITTNTDIADVTDGGSIRVRSIVEREKADGSRLT